MFPLKDIPIQIFGALFSLRWLMAALGSSLALIGNGDKVFGSCDSCNTYQHNLHYLLFTWAALAATILILGFLTGYALKRNDRSQPLLLYLSQQFLTITTLMPEHPAYTHHGRKRDEPG